MELILENDETKGSNQTLEVCSRQKNVLETTKANTGQWWGTHHPKCQMGHCAMSRQDEQGNEPGQDATG